MAIQNPNLQPLEKLLREEDPLEIARYLDDVMLTLVQQSDNDGHLEGLGHRYYILRTLRNAFTATTKPDGHGN